MKVDEELLQDRAPYRAKCPHCLALCALPHTGESRSVAEEQATEAQWVPGNSLTEENDLDYEPGPAFIKPHEADIWDEEIPEGALFPAEHDAGPSVGAWMKSFFRTFIWVVISLAIVAFFALIVNLVLPGPAGQRGVTGFTPPDMAETQLQRNE
jgi:ABC-type sugar transport system permease subunit